MLNTVHPKLPMRNKVIKQDYYVKKLVFTNISASDYAEYLILTKDKNEIHFFLFETLNTNKNYGQVYIRTENIETIYEYFLKKSVAIHPNGKLETKPWGQKEFSLLDTDNNLLTFDNQFKNGYKKKRLKIN